MLKVYIQIAFIIITFKTAAQTFLTLDNDTHELIEEVNYALLYKGDTVARAVTKVNEFNRINESTRFDSLYLYKFDYEDLIIPKSKIDTLIYLNKKILFLDEVVISNKRDNTIQLGELNRFVKRRSTRITDSIHGGILFTNPYNKTLNVRKVDFFIDKAVYETNVVVKFFTIGKTKLSDKLQINNEIYTSDVVTISPKQKGKIEVPLTQVYELKPMEQIFVSIKLLNYNKEGQSNFMPELKEQTKLKYQISERTDFYNRYFRQKSKTSSEEFINVNAFFNYDYAYQFKRKPHKSILVAPAIVLYGVLAD